LLEDTVTSAGRGAWKARCGASY